MKISVAKQRQIARLLEQHDWSNRTVATHTEVSHNTVRIIRDQLHILDLRWEDLAQLDNESFTMRLGTGRKITGNRKPLPDWEYIHLELSRPDVTLELLWQEYRHVYPEGVSYPQLTRLYKGWVNRRRVSMRQVYLAGDVLFVDFCGRTMPITHPATGEIRWVQVFVAVLGASSRIFAYAVESQTIPDWIECHIRAFEYYGGVPFRVVPDNLKSAVLKHGRDKITTNLVYADLAEHYGFAIAPARPREPQDKALAEVSVKIVQSGVLAPLRNHTFFSIHELNAEIDRRVALINNRTSHKFPISRMDRFTRVEAAALRPLPVLPYEVCSWQYKVRVDEFYLIPWEGNRYSVPFLYAHQLVDIRASKNTVEVLYQRQRIASHARSYEVGKTFILEAHMPPNHQYQRDNDPERLLLWAKLEGAATFAYVQAHLADVRTYANGLKTVRYLRGWAREPDNRQRLEGICQYALSIKANGLTRLKSIIAHGAEQRVRPILHPPTPLIHKNLRGPAYFATKGEVTC